MDRTILYRELVRLAAPHSREPDTPPVRPDALAVHAQEIATKIRGLEELLAANKAAYLAAAGPQQMTSKERDNFDYDVQRILQLERSRIRELEAAAAREAEAARPGSGLRHFFTDPRAEGTARTRAQYHQGILLHINGLLEHASGVHAQRQRVRFLRDAHKYARRAGAEPGTDGGPGVLGGAAGGAAGAAAGVAAGVAGAVLSRASRATRLAAQAAARSASPLQPVATGVAGAAAAAANGPLAGAAADPGARGLEPVDAEDASAWPLDATDEKDAASAADAAASEAALDDFELTPQQQQQLLQENSALLTELSATLDQAHRAEKSMAEIASIQSELAMHLASQTEMIAQLADDAFKTTDDVGAANLQLESAKKRNRRASRIVIYASLAIALLLLVYDWLL